MGRYDLQFAKRGLPNKRKIKTKIRNKTWGLPMNANKVIKSRAIVEKSIETKLNPIMFWDVWEEKRWCHKTH
jgi:hypothetical protein